MIDPKELRIGNYYLSPQNEVERAAFVSIDSISPHRGFSPGWTISKCEPIKITREWLEQFGFQKEYNSLNAFRYELYLEHNRWLSDWGMVGFMLRGDNDFGVFIYDIMYVHQLQNLYFALTGQELTVKQPTETI
jgi:hypothetical protein